MIPKSQIDGVMAIIKSAFDPHWGEAWNRSQIEDILALPNTFLVLDSRDDAMSINGFLLTRHVLGEEELLLIAVHPNVRRQGIALRMLNELKQEAQRRNTSNIFLEMRENNPAKDLYLTFGFLPIGRRKSYYTTSSGDKIDAITYQLVL